ncbi:CAP domain-containing protein [Niallia sp. 01092]|uniref:CAP domain-containing protein n=1 Tax=unclassified Niallia TaxID=2837522 RepID=UPI003FD599E2
MKFKHLCSIFISMLFLLTACNINDKEKNNHINENDTISSLQTGLSSDRYPHTQPVKVQDAKYDFEPIENDQNMQQDNRQQPLQAETPQNVSQNQGGSEFVTAVIELTNAERQKNGLPALEAYPELSNVANVKAQDMNEKGYFSHTSPTYGSPFDMIRDFGISYQSAGENIAQGQQTPEEVVNAWMNSEGHRANILDNKFTHIGVGFEEADNEWVQMFVKK